MGHDILFAAWYLLPAAIANSAPVFAAKLPLLAKWDTPIDGGQTWRGTPILGDHKTWRGLASGIVLATATLWLQQLLATHTSWAAAIASPVDYPALPTLVLGPLFAIGALGGDAIESFVKRRRGIVSGRSWVPFDQLDYIIGAIVATLPIVMASPAQYTWMLVVWFIMHLVGSYTGWLLHLKKDPI